MNAETPVTGARLALDIAVDDKTWGPVGDRPALTVLRHLHLKIAARSFVVVTGPSGCGKSTLLNIVAGLDPDYCGSTRFPTASPKIAFIFQTPRLLPWRTIEQNIALSLPDHDPRQADIPEMLARVGLSGAETAYPERLSLGMQRRVALARGFIQQPDILLMDEPFVSLDDPTAESLRTLVVDLWRQRQATVLFVTHDRQEAVRLGTRVVRLRTLPGESASVPSLVSDCEVRLDDAARADPSSLRAEQLRIFAA